MHETKVAERLVDGNTEGSRKVRRVRWLWIRTIYGDASEVKRHKQR